MTLAVILPKTMKPQRYERLSEKWAGMWIKNESGRGTPIVTTVPRVAYYAEGKLEYLDLTRNELKIDSSLKGTKTFYLVLQDKDSIIFPEPVEAMRKDFVEVARFEKRDMEKIIVFRKTGS